jgi:hypothetical protein
MWGLGSASMIRTSLPSFLNWFASRAMIVVFPTPPLPLIAIFISLHPVIYSIYLACFTIMVIFFYKLNI